MGGSNSKVGPANQVTTAKTKKSNRDIEEKLLAEIEEEGKAVKCLLLGAGESGKSTILKQMKILHMNGFTDDEKMEFKYLIRKNTLQSIQTLVEACNNLEISLDSQANRQRAANIKQIKSDQDIPLHIKEDIKALWKDKGIERCLAREREFHLIDSAPYFLKHVDRIFLHEYFPSLEDILRSRLTTTGIIETQFELEGLTFKMYDVGGQRGERTKWIHCFDDVTAILFIASLSEYDQVLAEDRTRNRLEESLDLFEGIINLPWFDDASVILFLNKQDLFLEKIKKVDIGIYFPDYTGGCDYDAGLAFIQEEYESRNSTEDTFIYAHVTDATNTENVQFVWRAAKHIILEKRMEKIGFA